MSQWAILCCLINNSDKRGLILSLLKPELFLDHEAQSVFLYILELFKANISPNLEIIKSKLGGDITKNLEIEVDPDNYSEFIKHLKEQYAQIKIKELGDSIVQRPEININKFKEYVGNLLDNIYTENTNNTFFSDDIVDNVLKKINSEYEIVSPIVYGIPSIDENTGGLFPGKYVIVAGRPSMGKSGLIGHIAMVNALQGNTVLLFSLEMPAEDIAIRMIGSLANVELWKLKRLKNRNKKEQETVMSCSKQLKESNLIIDTTPGADIDNIYSVIQRVIMQKRKIDLILIDYLQLMTGKNDQENDNTRVSNISKELKKMAMKYNCPIVIGSQLSRSCESRDNKRPILSDLRDSGSIEQDADSVFMLYRDHYYTQNPEYIEVLEVDMKKYRNGEIRKFVLDYNMKKQTFSDINWNSALGKKAKRFMYE